MTPLTVISSMATRQLLAELGAAYQRLAGIAVSIESVGGVDAARRVEAGEAFDIVLLASNAIDKLMADGHVLGGSRVDITRSEVAVAVREGDPVPDIGSEQALREAVLGAASVGYSTGPSGVALVKLFEGWGILGQLGERLLQSPPGVPVGSMVASGQVQIGFQQLSELTSLTGIHVIGTMPAPLQIVTVFSGGIGAKSGQGAGARTLLNWLASSETAPIKRRHGMSPA